MKGIFKLHSQFCRSSSARRCNKNMGGFPTQHWEMNCPELCSKAHQDPGKGREGGGCEEDVAP